MVTRKTRLASLVGRAKPKQKYQFVIPPALQQAAVEAKQVMAADKAREASFEPLPTHTGMPSQIRDKIQKLRERDIDPSGRIKGMPPNWGDFDVPHVVTFQGIISTIAKVYRPSDQAIQDSLENARYMLNDLLVLECIEQRMRSTALLDWHIEPEDETDPKQKDLAAKIDSILRVTPRFMQYREALLRALWFGRYGIRHRYRWGMVEGQRRIILDRWEPIHGDKLCFRYDDGTYDYDPDQVGIRIGAGFHEHIKRRFGWNEDRLDKIQQADFGLAYFLDPWERRLIAVHKHQIEDGEYEDIMTSGRIHGVGIRHRIYWTWYQMKEALAWLMEFLERSAFGMELWYYPWGDKTAEERMRTAAQERIGQGRNIVLVPRPLGDTGMAYGVERIEANMAGAEVLKDILHGYFGHQIKRYVLGQTLTTEAQPTGLGSNLASVHLDTYLQIVRYDATNLEETLSTDLVAPLVHFNEPRMQGCRLRFKIETESPDVEGRLASIKSAWEIGARIKESDVHEAAALSPPDVDDVVLQNPQTSGQGQGQPGQPGQAAPGGNGSGPGAANWAFEGPEAATKGNGQQKLQARGNPIPGGLGDRMTLGDVDREQAKRGVQVEGEHTGDPAIALDIALDHLAEDPGYYGKESATPEDAARRKVREDVE